MAQPQSLLDKIFMRGKDTVLIIGAIGSMFVVCVKYYNIPETVAAQGEQLKNVQAYVNQSDKQIAVIQSDLKNIRDNQSDMKEGQKAMWTTLRSIDNKIPKR